MSRSSRSRRRPYHLNSSAGDNSFGFEEAVKLTKGSSVGMKSTFSTGEPTTLSSTKGELVGGILVTRTFEHSTHGPGQTPL